jgi:response regulator RpfG family c-di-GMP phosphodiesterase
MRKHPLYAYNLLYPISQLRPALEIPYCHHERWDGTGYPHGLAGESIPLSARAFAVVDVWDAFRSQRVFRPAWPDHKILKRIQGLAGTVFDPMVVEKFMAMIEQAVPQTQVLPEPIQQTRHKKG